MQMQLWTHKPVKVNLIWHTPLETAVVATRTCWDSLTDYHESIIAKTHIPLDSLHENDQRLLERIVLQNHHESVIEHINYTFSVSGLSRGVLLELERHRIASMSVKSSRYTLGKDLKNETDIESNLPRYCALTGSPPTDYAIYNQMLVVRELLQAGRKNDEVKLALPEAFKCDLIYTINARSLRNLLTLRTDSAAWKFIREFAMRVYGALPQDHLFLYEDCVKEVDGE
jgi:thymidylate synthase (FAD)